MSDNGERDNSERGYGGHGGESGEHSAHGESGENRHDGSSSAAATIGRPGEVTSVGQLDLSRYLGLWFEIGRLPLRFEDDDAEDVTAEYSLNDDGKVRVDNRCLDSERKPTQAIGQAQPDSEHAGRLRVTFLPEGLRWIPFTRADYWVLRIDEEYRVALVGTPDHRYLWLLARSPRVSEQTERDYLDSARTQGFELAEWIRTPQSGERVTDMQLDGA